MREFHLDTSGALAQTTVRRTPRPDVNQTATLANWVNAHASAILADAYDVDDQYPGTTPFKGGNALMAPNTFWQGSTSVPITDPKVRHLFSLNTCSGCHARETSTVFTHISPTGPAGQPAALSGFLTGITVTDPVVTTTTPTTVGSTTTTTARTFNDLERRRTVLADIANRSCLFQVFRVPPAMSH
jgi:hypothetical protein